MRMQFLYNKTNLKMSKKFFLALLAPLFMGGLVACNKQASNDLTPEGQSTGDTYISVTFSTANPNSTARAAKEDIDFNSIGEYMGRDKIENVNIYMINALDESIEVKKFDNTNNFNTDPDNNAKTRDYRTEAWPTSAGKKFVYVYVNIKGTEIETALDGAHDKASFEKANNEAYALVENGAVKTAYAKLDDTDKKDVIAMNTIARVELDVKGGVKKKTAEDGTENCAKVTVRRLVGQAAVTSTAATYEIKEKFKSETETTLATLGDFKWDVMQFEQKTYLMPQPTEANADVLKVAYCKTPSFEFITTDANYTTGTDNAGDKYAYRAFTGEKVETFTRDANDETNVANIVKNPMKFITETTHLYGGKLKADGGTAPFTGYRKGNTAYVIVSAKITPDEAAWATGQKEKAGEDLYFGILDHKFYKEEATAVTANKPSTALPEGKDNVIKYAGGICYYVAWLNPNDKKDPTVSPVLRNNIYHVNITGMKELGYTRNPFDPTDNTPKDPDDPKTPDPKDPLYPSETHMSVQINVVNWGVHSRDQEF